MRENNQSTRRRKVRPNRNAQQEGQSTQEVTQVTQVSAQSTSSDNLDLTQVPADIPGFRANVAFRIAVEDAARQAKLPVSSFIYKTIGDALGQPVEVKTARSKMTEEEKKAKDEAAKAEAKAERARARELLKNARLQTAESSMNGSTPSPEPDTAEE